MNNEFQNEVFSGFEPNPVPACTHCGEKPKLLRKMLNSQNGRTTRMFKCDCCEQTWSEDKELQRNAVLGDQRSFADTVNAYIEKMLSEE